MNLLISNAYPSLSLARLESVKQTPLTPPSVSTDTIPNPLFRDPKRAYDRTRGKGIMWRIENHLNNVENVLFKASTIFPFAAAPRIIIGVAQLVTALVCTIFASIAFVFTPCLPATKNTSLLDHSLTHIKHGLGNIVAGILGIVPGASMLMKMASTPPEGWDFHVLARLKTGHEQKFMPYKSLVESDWKIYGTDDEIMKRVHRNANAKIAANGGMNNLSESQKMKLAQAAIFDVKTELQKESSNRADLDLPFIGHRSWHCQKTCLDQQSVKIEVRLISHKRFASIASQSPRTD